MRKIRIYINCILFGALFNLLFVFVFEGLPLL